MKRSIAFAVVAVMVLASVFVFTSADDSTADSVDYTKYYYNQLDATGKAVYDKALGLGTTNPAYAVKSISVTDASATVVESDVGCMTFLRFAMTSGNYVLDAYSSTQFVIYTSAGDKACLQEFANALKSSTGGANVVAAYYVDHNSVKTGAWAVKEGATADSATITYTETAGGSTAAYWEYVVTKEADASAAYATASTAVKALAGTHTPAISVTAKLSDYKTGSDTDEVAMNKIMSAVKRSINALQSEQIYLYQYDMNTQIKASYNSTEATVTVIFNENHYYPVDCASKLTAALNAVVVDTTSAQTIVTSIDKHVIDTVTYDEAKTPGTKVRSVYTAAVDDHVVVCEGYAKFFKALCDKYNVPCLLVMGNAKTSEGTEGHMWNYVLMDDDHWYLVDCTWNDQSVSSAKDKYLLVGTNTVGLNGKKVSETHFEDMTSKEGWQFTLPTLATEKYDGVEKGKVGGLDWTYSCGSHTLTISGKGEMPTLSKSGYGWASHAGEITDIVISDGVTSIGDYAFAGCTSLKNLTVADSVATVGAHAFDGNTFKSVDGTTDLPLTNLHGESFAKNASGNMVLNVRQYDAVFKADGKVVGTVKYTLKDVSIDAPAVPEKEGHNGSWEPYTLEQYGITVNAVYDKKEYTFTYNNYDGTLYQTIKNLYMDPLTLPTPDPTRPDSGPYSYEFSGWDGYAVGDVAKGDKTFTATFTTVIGDLDPVADMSVTINDVAVILSATAMTKMKAEAESDSNATFTANLSTGSIKLDATAIKSLASGKMSFKMTDLKGDDFPEATKKFIKDNTVYSVVLGSKVGGAITITVPYDSAGKDTSNLRACWLSNGAIVANYDVTFSEGYASFTVPHLSTYVIMNPNDASPSDNADKEKTALDYILTPQMIGMFAFVLVLAIITAAYNIRQKKKNA